MVTVRYWAGARAAAGRSEERLPVGTVGELLRRINADPGLSRVVPACSLLVDGVGVRREDGDRLLPAGAVVDVLPPFAGG